MAIYHLSIKIISRGRGKSAVASAAYRAGEKITNEYDGVTHDYTRKVGIVHTEIFLPDHAPAEYKERAILWNAVEKCERYKTAQLSREIEIALPREFTQSQNISLVRKFVKDNFTNAGMCADVAIHEADSTDENGNVELGGNPHAHIMLSMRPIEQDGTWGQKSRSINGQKVPTVNWNEHDKADIWRKAWETYCNAELKAHGHDVTIDSRSYEKQGLYIKPTIHLGVAAHQMEKRGIKTERGDINRGIVNINKEIRQANARIKKLKTQIYSLPIENTPSFIDVMSHIADAKNLNKRWQKIANLQTQAQVLIFLQENSISDMESFVDKVTKMSEDLHEASGEIKKADRRLETLELHLAHCENLRQHKSVYQKYKSLAPDKVESGGILEMLTKKQQTTAEKQASKQNAFYVKHSAEIEAYKDAEVYLKAVLNGRTQIPISTWQAEQKELTTERFALAEKFYGIKDEIKSAEVLRRGLEELMRGEVQCSQIQKRQDFEK